MLAVIAGAELATALPCFACGELATLDETGAIVEVLYTGCPGHLECDIDTRPTQLVQGLVIASFGVSTFEL